MELQGITSRNLCSHHGAGLEYKTKAERVGFDFSLAANSSVDQRGLRRQGNTLLQCMVEDQGVVLN